MRLYRVLVQSGEDNVPVRLSECPHTYKGNLDKYDYYFVLPEQAEMVLRDGRQLGYKTVVETVDVPFKEMGDGFGLFEYEIDMESVAPVINVRLPKEKTNDLDAHIWDNIKPEWLNDDVYRTFLQDKAEFYAPVQKGFNPSFNKNYNTKRLFSKDELEKENVDLTDFDKVYVSSKRNLLNRISKLIKKDNHKEL